MENLVISDEKLQDFKSRFIYFNHYQELKKFESIEWDLIPQEYRFFMNNDRPHKALSFYNSFCGCFLGFAEGKEDLVILETIECLSEKNQESIKRKLEENEGLWNRLLDRSNATYRIDLDRSRKNKVTHSLLHMFSSAYENTEVLLVLFWICQSLTGKKLNDNFENYKDRYGNYLKGRLITDIVKILEGNSTFKEFKNLLEKAYHKELRHLSFHNSAFLDDNTRMIVGIDNPSLKIDYSEAFKSFYFLQQLQNYIRMFINVLMIDDNEVMNEGIFAAISFQNNEENRILGLLQLEPFYVFDWEKNLKLGTLSVSVEGDYYIFQTNKQLLKVKKDSSIDSWYKKPGEKEIHILSAVPDLFVEKGEEWRLFLPQYGTFLIQDRYEVNTIIT